MRSVKILIVAIAAASLAAGCAQTQALKPGWSDKGECAATRKAPSQRWRAVPPRGCTPAAH